MLYCLKVLGGPCSTMNHGLCGLSVPRRNTSNDLLRRVGDGLSWFRRMGRRWEFGRRLGAMKNVYLLYCLKVLGGPCSAMNNGLCGLSVPRRNTSNDILRRVADGMLWFCRMGRWEFGRRLGAMKKMYICFIVSRYLMVPVAP